MTTEPKVSVIIPVYNVEKYLHECLDSIINQTLTDIEIICVDDGSTDASLSILKDYEAKDPRVKVLTTPHLFAGHARNVGLKVACGEYLSFLDADDFFELTMLEKSYYTAKTQNAQVVIFGSKTYIEDTHTFLERNWSVNRENIPVNTLFSAKDAAPDFFMNILGYAWDKLFKREFILSIPTQFQEIPVFNDAFFTYSALLMADRIYFLDEVLAYQRRRISHDSISNNREKYFDSSYRFLHCMKVFMQQKDIYPQFKQDFINYCIHMLCVDIRSKSPENKTQMITLAKYKWVAELDLLHHEESYFYNQQERSELMDAIFDIAVPPQSPSAQNSFDSDATNTIPVVYASDKNYLKYTIVSAISILSNASTGTKYRFILLLNHTSTEYETTFRNALKDFSNWSLECYSVGDKFNNSYLCIKHITQATYYRLVLPELLPDCDKCLYLDGDTVICDDLTQLYTINMGNNLLAGVPAYAYLAKSDYHKERLEFNEDETFTYVNAGILVMNLAQMRKEKTSVLFDQLLDKEFSSQDQDILNVACKNRIMTLPFLYNVMTKYRSWGAEKFKAYTSPKEILYARKHPVIIHYADRIKPWDDLNSSYAEEWIKYATKASCLSLLIPQLTIMSLRALRASKAEISILKREMQTLQNANLKNQKKIIKELTTVKKELKKPNWFIRSLRKIVGGICCWRDHGLFYTVKRSMYKLSRLFNVLQ